MPGRKWQNIDWRGPFLPEQQPTQEHRAAPDVARQARDICAQILGRTQTDFPAC